MCLGLVLIQISILLKCVLNWTAFASHLVVLHFVNLLALICAFFALVVQQRSAVLRHDIFESLHLLLVRVTSHLHQLRRVEALVLNIAA